MAGRPGHRGDVLAYLQRLFAPGRRLFSCAATAPEGVRRWQEEARPALRHLLGLDAMHDDLHGHTVRVELGEPKDLGEYTRQLGHIGTEPEWKIPFWLLRPKGDGPSPLGVFPHGHSRRGFDQYVGIAHGERDREKIEREDRDVAVQAARHGFLAIAPTTRGFEPAAVPDINGRHGRADCRSQLVHCLLAGRTAMGERVWDMERLLDWAAGLPEVDSRRILMMGNSGGGMVTIYAAACDTRIAVAVPSCSFCTLVGQTGLVHHCDCNAVPGIGTFGELYDVAGLIAPRHLLVVNGREDPLFPLPEVDRSAAGVRRIYAAAGIPERFAHRYGDGGHRFYKHLMWPFIHQALAEAR